MSKKITLKIDLDNAEVESVNKLVIDGEELTVTMYKPVDFKLIEE